ncbi:YceI family protein [Vibrio sp. S9_S30]|uniref:YceI family protein n=1 Tax=Vibrio sp. S9_S30 TaxID=2720226 RepID=UPI001681A5AF|nr:YceI family protein [Vibrio sp. S9_S30]MBD1558704.1 YceI family protein [Vibrio sp. S9_S30]
MKKSARRLLMASALFSLSVLSAFPALSARDQYLLDSDVSSVNFASIKKQYVVEPASFTGIDGRIDANGAFTLDIELASVDTLVPIRNQRLSELFFNTGKYPKATLSGRVDLTEISSLTQPTIKNIEATLNFYGIDKEVTLSLLIVNTPQYIVVSSVKPVIVSAASFGLPDANLTALSETVGAIAISPTVSVNASLVFKRK